MNSNVKRIGAAVIILILSAIAAWIYLRPEPPVEDQVAARAEQIQAEIEAAATTPPADPPPTPSGVKSIRGEMNTR